MLPGAGQASKPCFKKDRFVNTQFAPPPPGVALCFRLREIMGLGLDVLIFSGGSKAKQITCSAYGVPKDRRSINVA